jgi:NodT family efflux transporter outer membrane factor (OMF) lipoprotein
MMSVRDPAAPSATVLAVRVLTACGCALLTACAIGPDYKRPTVDVTDNFKEAGDWKPTQPADALSRGPWWQIFNDEVLNGLEEQVEISNLNVKAAAAAVEQARALVSEAQAGYWPTLSAGVSRTHSRDGRGRPHNTNSAQGRLDWPLDIWGQVRRSVESAKASEQLNEATLASARLAAQAELALDYFALRGQDQLQTLLDDTVKADELSMQITQNRYRVGVAARADVVTAQTQLLSSQAQQTSVAIQRGTLEHAIAVLVGKQPALFAVPRTAIRTDVPTVPAGVPSELLERRPDIAEAERRVASANAQIGVAKGAYFPSLSLTGTVEYAAGGALSQLFRIPNQTWSVGPGLTQILFAGGLHRAEVAAAKAEWEITVDDYRQTVLQGFQQVEDELVTLRVLEQQSIVEEKLVQAAREAERLTLNQYKAGTVPYSSVITAQTTRLASEQSALTVFIDRLTASVTLIEALGGGWSASQLKPTPPPAPAGQSPPPQALPPTQLAPPTPALEALPSGQPAAPRPPPPQPPPTAQPAPAPPN